MPARDGHREVPASRSLGTLALVSSAAGLLLADAAAAQPLYDIWGGQVEFYGQLSPTLLVFDDGEAAYSRLLDNDQSNSRLGFNIDHEAGGFDLRFKAEVSMGFPSTGSVSQVDDPRWEWNREDIRKLELIASGSFGTVAAGQGSMATDGVAEADLSGTTMVGYSNSASDTAGSFFLRDGDGALSDITINGVFKNFDGGRRFRLRYDTPSVQGFSAAFAYGSNALDGNDEDIYRDLALRYGNEFASVEVEGAVGYRWRDLEAGGTEEIRIGSLSVAHGPTGLNATIAAGSEVDGGEYYYLKAGWIAGLLSVGKTALSTDYYRGEDFVTEGAISEHWGLEVTQYFDDLDLEGYLGYRRYSYDDTAVDYREASSALAGIRWRF